MMELDKVTDIMFGSQTDSRLGLVGVAGTWIIGGNYQHGAGVLEEKRMLSTKKISLIILNNITYVL